MTEAKSTQISIEAAFVCDCLIWQRNACLGESFYAEHEGKPYCILHYPAVKDLKRLDSVIKRKLEAQDFDFSGVYFADAADFRRKTFTKDVDFSGATFKGKADFWGSLFQGRVDFRSATFDGYATFETSAFNQEIVFSEVNFNQQAVFAQVEFHQTAGFHFSWFHQRADFGSSIFKATANFHSTEFGKESSFYKTKFQQSAGFNNAKFTQEASFYSAVFEGQVDFGAAVFAGVADFNTAEFKAAAGFGLAEFVGQARFFSAVFKGEADFTAVTFGEMANFMSSMFSGGAVFSSATFNSVIYFDNIILSGAANFSHTSFKDVARFSSNEKKVFLEGASLDLEFARIDKPERIAFHGIELHPHWFVNVDSRKFEFVDVEWLNEINWSRTFSPKAELKSLIGKVSSPNRLLSITYRQLAVNAEENHRYTEASRLRYAAMESRRLETHGGFVPWRLAWWYWLASGYGESSVRAFWVFAILIALFSFGYTRVDFEHTVKPIAAASDSTSAVVEPNTKRLDWKEAIAYSLNVSILQKPEPKPFSFQAKLLVWLETVLGPAQAALLALAVRRRFMR